MRLSIVGNVHVVTLSRRNLIALLTKLDHESSACTLIKQEAGGLKLVVHAEEDDEHYRDRPEGGPGEMVPFTEADIREFKSRTCPKCLHLVREHTKDGCQDTVSGGSQCGCLENGL